VILKILMMWCDAENVQPLRLGLAHSRVGGVDLYIEASDGRRNLRARLYIRTNHTHISQNNTPVATIAREQKEMESRNNLLGVLRVLAVGAHGGEVDQQLTTSAGADHSHDGHGGRQRGRRRNRRSGGRLDERLLARPFARRKTKTKTKT
jgi:hypothetical protein